MADLLSHLLLGRSKRRLQVSDELSECINEVEEQDWPKKAEAEYYGIQLKIVLYAIVHVVVISPLAWITVVPVVMATVVYLVVAQGIDNFWQSRIFRFLYSELSTVGASG